MTWANGVGPASQQRSGEPGVCLETVLDMDVAGIKASLMDTWCVQSHGDPSPGEPCAWFNVCGQHPEILSFELVFCKWRLMRQRSVHRSLRGLLTVPFCPDGADTFHLNWNLFWMHREGDVVLRNISDQGTLSYAFFPVLLPHMSQPLTLRMITHVEKNLTQLIPPFPSSLGDSSVSRRERVVAGCAGSRKWSDNSWVRFIVSLLFW